MKRFGAMEAGIQGGNSEELEAKRKARMERFGEAEVKEAQRNASTKKQHHIGERDGDQGKNINRRKAKLLRKLQQK